MLRVKKRPFKIYRPKYHFPNYNSCVLELDTHKKAVRDVVGHDVLIKPLWHLQRRTQNINLVKIHPFLRIHFLFRNKKNQNKFSVHHLLWCTPFYAKILFQFVAANNDTTDVIL